MSGRLLSVSNLAYGYPGKTLGSGIHFELESGQLCLIGGPNGAGKSTLLKVLLGRLPARAGNIETSLRRTQVAYIPQIENTEIHLPMTLGDVLTVSGGEAPTPARISEIGLLTENHLTLAWNTASGGERKRTLLTRALLRNPKLLILDEPMNHLDETSRFIVISALKKFVTEADGRAIILVSHGGLSESEAHQFKVVNVEIKGTEDAGAA